MTAEQEQATASGCRVLVVEDDPSSRRALIQLLRLRGFHVTFAETVAHALSRLEDHPSCVLLDMMLPDGNGATLLRHIRLNQLPIRVAVTTGAADWRSMVEGDFEPDAQFSKPLNLERLVDWIRSA